MLKFTGSIAFQWKKCKLKQLGSMLHFLDQQQLECWRTPRADGDVGQRNTSVETETDVSTAGKNLAVSG